jgi:Sap, sulfolipid-1-addressing protein
MPPQALALAFGASIYPPAVAAVIALGRGPQVRSRVCAFVLAALLVTYAVGALMLLVLVELGVTGSTGYSPSAAVDVALGVGLLALAAWLYRRRPGRPSASDSSSSGSDGFSSGEPSKIERYLSSRRLAFVLGLTLYALPSPIYIAAVKTIADASLSTSGELAALAVTVAVMLWLIELPMLMLLAMPARAASALEGLNLWFARNGRALAIVASAAVGVYLEVRGLSGLLG